jgi:hypothetical protein
VGARAVRAATTAAFAVCLPLLLAGCGLNPGATTAAWVWPTPFPRPSAAVPVVLDIEPVPSDTPVDVAYACPMALLAPMTPTYHADDEAQPIHYTLVENGQEVRLVWQAGFQAWLDPELQIVAPDGKVIAAEGQVATGLSGGGTGEGDDAFSVCLVEYIPRRAGAQP